MIDHEKWKEFAACRGQPSEWFFPVSGYVPWKALAVCSTCPVRSQCLAYARRNGEVGVWGGVAQGSQRNRMGRGNANIRKTECIAGHAFTDENTYVNAGRRKCRLCRAVTEKRRRQQKRLR